MDVPLLGPLAKRRPKRRAKAPWLAGGDSRSSRLVRPGCSGRWRPMRARPPSSRSSGLRRKAGLCSPSGSQPSQGAAPTTRRTPWPRPGSCRARRLPRPPRPRAAPPAEAGPLPPGPSSRSPEEEEEEEEARGLAAATAAGPGRGPGSAGALRVADAGAVQPAHLGGLAALRRPRSGQQAHLVRPRLGQAQPGSRRPVPPAAAAAGPRRGHVPPPAPAPSPAPTPAEPPGRRL
ncbi:hypothetical protein JRQ81_012639 [Phrynocephalus forsythii]|uniref:Uncharacterized protein n=1 Tax=Phrynocephalus forsythii TaxID=171643 RepID=A0A9Q1B611_9SAUR|nr:hypothetical protein JRQ81_012639 [Phrynocephalus forsythii]